MARAEAEAGSSVWERVSSAYRGEGREGPSRLGRWLSLPMVGVILVYRVSLSVLMGRQCRFEPTCSRYGLDAYRAHGVVRGTVLTAARILRCQPMAKSGYDPVPMWGHARSPTIEANRAELAASRYRDHAEDHSAKNDQGRVSRSGTIPADQGETEGAP